jgi:hypothetical protein
MPRRQITITRTLTRSYTFESDLDDPDEARDDAFNQLERLADDAEAIAALGFEEIEAEVEQRVLGA